LVLSPPVSHHGHGHGHGHACTHKRVVVGQRVDPIHRCACGSHTHMPVCKPTHTWSGLSSLKTEMMINRGKCCQRSRASSLVHGLSSPLSPYQFLTLCRALSRPLSRRKTPLSRSRAHTQTRTHTHTHARVIMGQKNEPGGGGQKGCSVNSKQYTVRQTGGGVCRVCSYGVRVTYRCMYDRVTYRCMCVRACDLYHSPRMTCILSPRTTTDR